MQYKDDTMIMDLQDQNSGKSSFLGLLRRANHCQVPAVCGCIVPQCFISNYNVSQDLKMIHEWHLVKALKLWQSFFNNSYWSYSTSIKSNVINNNMTQSNASILLLSFLLTFYHGHIPSNKISQQCAKFFKKRKQKV